MDPHTEPEVRLIQETLDVYYRRQPVGPSRFLLGLGGSIGAGDVSTALLPP